MTRELKPVWIAVLVLGGLFLALLFLRGSEQLQPELLEAHIAFQIGDDKAARVGSAEIEAGTPFRLLAVVEANDWKGERFFYTDAEALEIEGRAVDGESLRPWDRREKVRILWFTVEGAPPYSEVGSPEELQRLRFQEIFQADWPQAWTVPGKIAPAVENFLPDQEDRREPVRFGTQRFHLRVEVFGKGSDLLPIQRLRTPGADDLESVGARVPSVSATLAGPLESLSRVFGLPQVEPSEDATSDMLATLAELNEGGLAFSRVPLLRSWLASIGTSWEALGWRAVELTGDQPWQPGAAVRAGSKVAFAYQDRGVIGSLDESDLCLDFDKGATVRTLGEVFIGEGMVELATVESENR